MPELKIGSLFSGYEGLGRGVQSVMGGDIAWVSDIDPGACKILAHRYPDVPNIGDIERIGLPYSDEEWKEIKAAQKFHGPDYVMPDPDWAGIPRVDVLTGGFPCQDVSAAGKRAGMKPGTRSGLWAHMAYAIDQLRPSLVVIENVRGLLSAEAHSDLEPCPWCVGDGSGVPLRALGAVLGDLADIGYDASWQGLRAADVGAPHGRFRVFVTAWPAADAYNNTTGAGREPGRASRGGTELAQLAAVAAHPDRATRGERRLAAPGQAEGGRSRSNAGGRGGASAADAHGDAVREQPVTLPGCSGTTVAGLAGTDAAADADRDGLGGLEELHGIPGAERKAVVERHDADRLAVVAGGLDWGAYTAAIRRWERLTRPAPNPTEPGKTGQPRLSPAFVEWMQGLPAGWVTNVPGLTRNEQLKALGNGVVPQQAAQALRLLLPDITAAAA